MPENFFPYINLFSCGRKFISSRKKIFFLPHAEKFPSVCRKIFIRMKLQFQPHETFSPSARHDKAAGLSFDGDGTFVAGIHGIFDFYGNILPFFLSFMLIFP